MTRKEINDIILSKKLSEFYIATLESVFTKSDYNAYGKRRVVYGEDNKNSVATKDMIDALFNSSEEECYALLESILGENGLTRRVTVITLIDGNIYDIVNSRFVSDNQKIIHYGNILKYFSENEISVGLISPYEVPGYEEETACIELDDEVMFIYEDYVNKHFSQKESEDKKEEFMREVKNKSLTK